MKRKIVFWAVIFSLVVVGGGGTAYYADHLQAEKSGQAAAEGEASTETAVARIGDLTIIASGSGQVVAQAETSLAFDQSGTVLELLVSVGDEVIAGTSLARLQINKSAAQWEAEVAAAELQVIQDQQALQALSENADVTAAQALLALEAAQNELEDMLDRDAEIAQAMQAMAQAETTVDQAEMALYISSSSPSDEDLYTAYASLLFKEKRLNELKEEIVRLKNKRSQAPDKAMRDQISMQLGRVKAQMYDQQIVYENALYRYNTLNDPADPVDVAVVEAQLVTAQLQLAQAQQNLEETKFGPSAADLAIAEANLAEAQERWESWKDGPDPQQVLLAEARLQTSQLALQTIRQEQLIVDLLAPLDGTVLALGAAVNERVTAGSTIVTLANLDQPMLEISMDETDLQSVQVGKRVEVTFDAIPDSVFTGSIVEVNPGIENANGSQVITALARLDEIPEAGAFKLLSGLNASVDVIAGEVTQAVLVPIEALHETSPGVYRVYVLVDNAFEPRLVGVGLMDATLAEITSGVQAGETVAIGALTTE